MSDWQDAAKPRTTTASVRWEIADSGQPILLIRLPMASQPKASSTGKSLVYATTGSVPIPTTPEVENALNAAGLRMTLSVFGKA